MSETDSNYSSNSDTESEYTDSSDGSDDDGSVGLARTRSAEKNKYKGKSQTRIPTDLATIDSHLSFITNQLYGEDISRSLSLRVLKAAFTMQKRYLDDKKKRGQSTNAPPKPDIRNRITSTFGISTPTYGSILQDYLKRGQVYVSNRSGNSNKKWSIIAKTKTNQVKLREFVRKRRMNRERVTARQVVDYFVSERLLHIPTEDNGKYKTKEFKAAYRCTRRFVARMKYKRGKRKYSIQPSKHQIVKRDRYLSAFNHNRSLPTEQRLREVYLDESYIHQHYHRNDDSIWDPNDEQDIKYSKDPGKGRRYCFAAAVQGPNWKDADDKAGLVPNSLWAFCPQKKELHYGDYHKVFNGQNFVHWFKHSLLPNLKEKSLIIMDNAAYHKIKNAPNLSKLKKEEVIAYMKSKNLIFDSGRSVADLKSMLKQWIDDNVPIEVERLAREKGHMVLFTPAYHSDLQPIELVWARVKGNVGRKYTKDTSLDEVYTRLLEEFQQLDTDAARDAVGKMIEKCSALTLQMYSEMDLEEQMEEERSNSPVEIETVGMNINLLDAAAHDADDNGQNNGTGTDSTWNPVEV
jgi:transposase